MTTLATEICRLLSGSWWYGATIEQLASVTNTDPDRVRLALGELDFHGLESSAEMAEWADVPTVFYLRHRLIG